MTPRPPRDRDTQLALELPHDEHTGLADFVRAPSNAKALDFLLAWPDWPHPVTVLAGPAGSGKSHLARIWADRSGARIVQASSRELTMGPLETANRFAVEDVGQGPFDEEALFHLVNRCLEPGGALLVTSDRVPAHMPLGLADLASRLRAATLAEIDRPDEALIEAVLVKQFADRQIDVGPGVTAFAVARMERSLAAARLLVALIDRRSLEEKRRVTRPLVAAVLREMGLGHDA